MPPDECRSEGTPSLSEGPDAWGEPFGSFLAFEKGTRRNGETLSGRYRRNGYVPYQQEIGRLSGRLREQARSHRWFGYIRQRQVGCQAVIAGRPAPTGDSGTSARDWSAVRPSSLAGQLPQGIRVHPRATGRLSGRLREQARSHSQRKKALPIIASAFFQPGKPQEISATT